MPVDATPYTSLQAHWMPFTANRAFKAKPRIMVAAEGVHYTTDDGRQVLDAVSGLWCVNAGHRPPKLVRALEQQLSTLDYSPAFQVGHPKAFALAEQLLSLVPQDFGQVFFCNSGSEAVDTALKIATAYQGMRGQGTRTRLIGRERGYHGVGFGGISVGGIVKNRINFGPMLPGVDHLPTTHNLEHNAFSRGQPAWGAHLADALEALVTLHDASTIAAVIVEPMAGSTGVLIPPVGYLQRLREICTKHGILLIFDEVITGFGRTGAPFGTQRFGVTPDIITCAKGLTNGAIPAGAVICKKEIYDTFMQAPPNTIELFHGYTYSGHPMAMAAGLATLEIYKEEKLFERAAALSAPWQEALHSLRGLPHVIDLRNIGMVGAIELAPRPGAPGARGMEIFVKAFESGLLVRSAGDIIALSPPLVFTEQHFDQVFTTLRALLTELS